MHIMIMDDTKDCKKIDILNRGGLFKNTPLMGISSSYIGKLPIKPYTTVKTHLHGAALEGLANHDLLVEHLYMFTSGEYPSEEMSLDAENFIVGYSRLLGILDMMKVWKN